MALPRTEWGPLEPRRQVALKLHRQVAVKCDRNRPRPGRRALGPELLRQRDVERRPAPGRNTQLQLAPRLRS